MSLVGLQTLSVYPLSIRLVLHHAPMILPLIVLTADIVTLCFESRGLVQVFAVHTWTLAPHSTGLYI